MIHLTANTTILLATHCVDFRKQIDGLVALVQGHLAHDPRDGALYVFINRGKTMIRILHYDGSGYWLATKRLSRTKYPYWPTSHQNMSPIAAKSLMTILRTGIENIKQIN